MHRTPQFNTRIIRSILVTLTAGCFFCGSSCTSYKPIQSAKAPPLGGVADMARLDLAKYHEASVLPFTVLDGNVDPVQGEKFAADIFTRIKSDFGPLFRDVRFGNPQGRKDELIIAGAIIEYDRGTFAGHMFQGLPFGKPDLDAELVLRDGGTQQEFFRARVSKLWGWEEYWLGTKSIDRKNLEAAAAVANTIARGKGWQP